MRPTQQRELAPDFIARPVCRLHRGTAPAECFEPLSAASSERHHNGNRAFAVPRRAPETGASRLNAVGHFAPATETGQRGTAYEQPIVPIHCGKIPAARGFFPS